MVSRTCRTTKPGPRQQTAPPRPTRKMKISRSTQFIEAKVRGWQNISVSIAGSGSDLVQETFLRFAGYAQRETLRNPVAMLHRIARNLLFEQTRRYKTRGAKETTLDSTAEIAVQPTQIREIEARQMMDAYQRAVDLLPPRTREVFLLHRVDSLSYKEIAAQLGIGLRTVEWHMTEALLRLRRMMDEQ